MICFLSVSTSTEATSFRHYFLLMRRRRGGRRRKGGMEKRSGEKEEEKITKRRKPTLSRLPTNILGKKQGNSGVFLEVIS